MGFFQVSTEAESKNKRQYAGYDFFFFQIINNKVVPAWYDWDGSSLSSSSTKYSCHLKATYGSIVCAAYIISKGWRITYW